MASVTIDCDETGNLKRIDGIALDKLRKANFNTGEPIESFLCTTDSDQSCVERLKASFLDVVYTEEKDTKLDGGQLTYYKFECVKPNYQTEVNAVVLPITPSAITSKQTLTHPVPHTTATIALKLKLEDGTTDIPTNGVALGTHLKLQMTLSGSTTYNTLQPLSCSAAKVPADGQQNDQTVKVPIWNACDSNITDTAVIGKHWTPNSGPSVVIDLYAFHFHDSTNVNIICETLVCTSATCPLNCPSKNTGSSNMNGRKRRGIEADNRPNSPRSKLVEASTSFKVINTYSSIGNSAEGISKDNLTYFVSMALVLSLRMLA